MFEKKSFASQAEARYACMYLFVQPEEFLALVKKYPDIFHNGVNSDLSENGAGYTIAHYLARKKRSGISPERYHEILTILKNGRVDLKRRDRSNRPPLYHALSNNNFPAAKALIEFVHQNHEYITTLIRNIIQTKASARQRYLTSLSRFDYVLIFVSRNITMSNSCL